MKKLSFRIWLVFIILLLSLLAIFSSSNGITLFQKGVLVTSVEQNSSAYEYGLRQNQIITAIDGVSITNVSDYSKLALNGEAENHEVNLKDSSQYESNNFIADNRLITLKNSATASFMEKGKLTNIRSVSLVNSIKESVPAF